MGELYNALDFNNEGVIYLGIGENFLDLNAFKALGFQLGSLLNKRKLAKVTIDLALLNNNTQAVKLFLEGLANTQHNFDHYKKDKVVNTLKEVSFINVDEKLIKETFNIIEGINTTRNLVNTTPIDLYPESYANYISKLFKDTKVEVFNKE